MKRDPDTDTRELDLRGFQKPGSIRGSAIRSTRSPSEPYALPVWYKPAAYTYGLSKPSLRPSVTGERSRAK